MLVLPHPSVNDHVLVIITAQGSVLSVASIYVAFNEVEQLSDSSVTSPVSERFVASSSQFIIRSEGAVKLGGVSSCMVIMWIISKLFPHSSVTVYVLVITIGHTPLTRSEKVRINSASIVTSSFTKRGLPGSPSASNSAIVVAAAGASEASQAWIKSFIISPVTVGETSTITSNIVPTTQLPNVEVYS